MNAGSLRRVRPRDGLGNWALDRLMSRLACGSLSVRTPGGATLLHCAPEPGPHGELVLHRWAALRRLLLAGDVGFAESFMDGEWSSSDVVALLSLASRNVDALGQSVLGLKFVRGLHRLTHALRSNTPRRARTNIEAHYDLGNDFYASWLDADMNYSSGLHADPQTSLEAAQAAKQDRVMALLQPSSGHKVLEVGCGWGALAKRMATGNGASVTAITLSPAQHGWAARALDGTATDLRLQDYRDVTGTFDRIVSIEMLEAVGEAFWPTYFKMLHDRLAPGGTAVLQVITIEEWRFPLYQRSADFIQRHVFPGGMLPTVTILHDQIRTAGLQLVSEERFGESYALTLAAWSRRFQAAWPALAATFDNHFRKRWEYYLAYCEAGFRTGAIDVGLYSITKPA